MAIDEQPVTRQLAEFERIVRLNSFVEELLGRMSGMSLPDRWLAAGALFQTVWNVLSGHEPQAGILDYDINYFDATDLSWEAENDAIARATALFDGIPAEIQIRNQARVHLWYEQKFEVPCPPYRAPRHAICTFPNCSSCVAIRPASEGFEIFAPYGLTDPFRMTTRPNPVLAPASVYEAKTSRWAAQWPELTTLPWPEATAPADSLTERGLGILTAAKLIGEIAGIDRFDNDTQLARLAGCAPIPVSSGNTNRYRLDPGGNRQLNNAFYALAISKMRHDPQTAVYIAKQRARGKTQRDAIRSLKRHLVRRIYRLLKDPNNVGAIRLTPVRDASAPSSQPARLRR